MKYQNIYDEYIETLKQYNDIYNKIENLPKGYLTSRTINNKKYYYLQQTVNGKKKSKCLHVDEIESTKKSIEQRKLLLNQLDKIKYNLFRLESAVKILDSELNQHFYFVKQCYQMDNLPYEQRPKAIKFAKAMTSLEGLPISFDLNSKLNLWIDGEILFSDIYLPTLKNYGVLKNV